MATRLLLTLLALLTGLAAQIAPVQARFRADGATAVGTVAAQPRNEQAAARRQDAARQPAERRWTRDRCTASTMMRPQVNCAPPVMLGIDRSRE